MSSHSLGSHYNFDLSFGFDLDLGIMTAGPLSHLTCYSCNQCDFKAISKVHLNSHATFSHSSVIKDIYKVNQTNIKSNTEFPCDKCNYITGSSTGLEAHMAFAH